MNDSIKNEIMQKIKKDEIPVKSRWLFWAEKIGLQSGLAFGVLILIFLFNAFFYYIKTNDLLMSLHYGDSVWQKFLHSLPYDLISTIIVLTIGLNLIVKKFDFSYKKPFVIVITIMMVAIVLLSSLLFSTQFNYSLRHGLQNSEFNVPFLTDFYVHRCCTHNICEHHE